MRTGAGIDVTLAGLRVLREVAERGSFAAVAALRQVAAEVAG
ncbi:hypothetical protein [Streptomyces sp. NPDC059080]